jgi:ssDNA thymidine ADP-ribosyltransferase, DarT
MDIDDIWVFRIIHIQNLATDLKSGLYAKNNAPSNSNRIVIGHKEIIEERDYRPVKCHPSTVVNDYVPFYFSVRTPMLYNIITEHNVNKQLQKDIVYLCCKFTDLIALPKPWCFTDGNAAKKITKFYTDISDINKIDWRSVTTTDFKHDNADKDEDRIRKKHAEFLVKDKVPSKEIREIAVLNNTVKEQVETIVSSCKLAVEVKVKPNFYF